MQFQSTLPARGATGLSRRPGVRASDFNPRSPHGERRQRPARASSRQQFQSTLPARGATYRDATRTDERRISIHAPRTGSDTCKTTYTRNKDISIHAPRTGSDAFPHIVQEFANDFNPRSPHGERLEAGEWLFTVKNISIHAPRTGSDGASRDTARIQIKFQSTLPARGATAPAAFTFTSGWAFQSTLPARGATLPVVVSGLVAPAFQSTLPARGATAAKLTRQRCAAFQSTLPARGATRSRRQTTSWSGHFNPRSPHGERHCTAPGHPAEGTFQSTLPARGATKMLFLTKKSAAFQSTLPARGATNRGRAETGFACNFNPRSPHGERHGAFNR